MINQALLCLLSLLAQYIAAQRLTLRGTTLDRYACISTHILSTTHQLILNP